MSRPSPEGLLAEARRAVQAVVLAARRKAEDAVAAGKDPDEGEACAYAEAANHAADALDPLNEAWHRLWLARLRSGRPPGDEKEA